MSQKKVFLVIKNNFDTKLYRTSIAARKQLLRNDGFRMMEFKGEDLANQFALKLSKNPCEETFFYYSNKVEENLQNQQNTTMEIDTKGRNKKNNGFMRQRLRALDNKYQELMIYYKEADAHDYEQVKNNKQYLMYFDGASSHNPGNSGIGLAFFQNLLQIKTISYSIGIKTNNQAEYMALLYGIRYALGQNMNNLICYGDSKIVIDTMSGQMRLHNKTLIQYHQASKDYASLLQKVKFEHINREYNKIADQLSKKGVLG